MTFLLSSFLFSNPDEEVDDVSVVDGLLLLLAVDPAFWLLEADSSQFTVTPSLRKRRNRIYVKWE
jgi:hypothetical protein